MVVAFVCSCIDKCRGKSNKKMLISGRNTKKAKQYNNRRECLYCFCTRQSSVYFLLFGAILILFWSEIVLEVKSAKHHWKFCLDKRAVFFKGIVDPSLEVRLNNTTMLKTSWKQHNFAQKSLQTILLAKYWLEMVK